MELDHVIRFRPEPAGEHAEPKNVAERRPGVDRSATSIPIRPAPSRRGSGNRRPASGRSITAEDEFCLLLAGTVELTDARGRTARFAAGDAFVIAAGFKGTWETVDPVKKLYAVYEKPKG